MQRLNLFTTPIFELCDSLTTRISHKLETGYGYIAFGKQCVKKRKLLTYSKRNKN